MPDGARSHSRPRHARRPISALVAEFVVLTAAGFLFVTSAYTANGTQLRNDLPDAVSRLRAEQARYLERAQQVAALRREIEQLTAEAAEGNGAVAALQKQSDPLLALAGVRQVQGAGLTVTLDDAPRTGSLHGDVRPDDLVVHQQDVQAVVNALWAGGARAIQLMDQRVIATSAVRCVGNTLILQGRVYSPPYRVTAVGDVTRMQQALAESNHINIYRQYVQAFGLGWSVVPRSSITIPGYSGPLELQHAKVASPPATGAGSAPTRTSGRSSTPTPNPKPTR